ncbi:MAG: MoxR family ATPase [Bacteroidetes bacterium]|nr:MoxR family ATPase [Bacteroidota bacterium]MCH8523622.1 MoxR family ATPase [Balneolales bacterium]
MSDTKPDLKSEAKSFQNSFELLQNEIGKVVVGQREVVDQLLISLFSNGHCVLVGVPGLAKTLLIKTLAQALNLDFNRIQFTPDLMPGDITGTEIIEENFETGAKQFKFVKGPIFSSIILADEINRTPPKTQAALLEAMQEFKVTAAGKTYSLNKPFFVLATQNPIEQEGTYPLPEAQLDRFMFNLRLNYPSFEEEIDIVQQTTSNQKVQVNQVLDAQQILRMQELTREVAVPESVLHFAVRLVNMTRPASDIAPDFVKKYMSWGAGPRASQNIILASKTRALALGRFSVIEEDIKALAAPVLRHRIVNNYAAEAEQITTDILVERLLNSAKS